VAAADVRWIVWGAGSIGRRHLRNLLARGERDVVALRRTAEPLPGELAAVPVHTTLASARGKGAAAAVVCTPTSHHIRDAIAAVEAGCDVLVEKPVSHTLEGIDRLRALSDRGARIVGVAHCLRFHPVLRRVQAALASGELGPPLAVSVWCGQHLADWHPGSDHTRGYSARRDLGGGVLLDLSHETDYLQWLFGPAVAVSGIVRNTGTLGIETEDVADLVLRLDTGIAAACHLDYLARPAVRGGWAVCERGTVRWDLGRATAERSDRNGWRPLPEAATEGQDMYAAELSAFAAAVASRVPFAVDLDAGARAVRVAVAATDASRDRREVPLT
jgi:predicted dehydrogenase